MFHLMDLPSLPDNAGVTDFDVSGPLIFHLIGRPELTSSSKVNRVECSRDHSGECMHASSEGHTNLGKTYKTPFIATMLCQLIASLCCTST